MGAGSDDRLVRVLASSELPATAPGEANLRRVRAGRSDVLLVRLAGGVAAFAGNCPHQGTPLDEATIFDDRLRCPRHVFLYDLHTGENIVPANDVTPEVFARLRPGSLAVHRAEERDGWIWVDPEPRPLAPPAVARSGAEARAAAVRAARPPEGGPVERPDEAVRVRVGEAFELTLSTAPLPGHVWSVDAAGAAVTLTAQRFAADPPPRHVLHLVANAPGYATLSCRYATPWGGDPAVVQRFNVRVDPP